MTKESPIRSQAQHAMLTRAATDTDYAKARGITCEAAKALLDGHAAAGHPKLPERAMQTAAVMSIATVRAAKAKAKLLGSH